MARLTGGPTTEFFSGRLTTIFGLSGLATSRITTESFPAGDTIGLPWSSHKSFSSLPTIRNGAAWTELKLTIARNVTPLNDERPKPKGTSAESSLFLRTNTQIAGTSAEMTKMATMPPVVSATVRMSKVRSGLRAKAAIRPPTTAATPSNANIQRGRIDRQGPRHRKLIRLDARQRLGNPAT